MNTFKVLPHPTDPKAELINCYDLNLIIKVQDVAIPINDDDMAIKGTGGVHEFIFIVQFPHLDSEHTLWSTDLFVDAIIFYFQERFDAAISSIWNMNVQALHPYTNVTDGLTNQDMTPLSDEDYNNFLNGRPFSS